MHSHAYLWLRRIISILPTRRSVLEFGSKDVNGQLRSLFSAAQYYGIDLVDGPGVDEVADAASFLDRVEIYCQEYGNGQGLRQYDTVVCSEVLEHTDKGRELCRNAHRHLLPGGIMIITAATSEREPHSAIDGGPLKDSEYYQNVSRADLEFWLSDFDRTYITCKKHGDIYAVAHRAG